MVAAVSCGDHYLLNRVKYWDNFSIHDSQFSIKLYFCTRIFPKGTIKCGARVRCRRMGQTL